MQAAQVDDSGRTYTGPCLFPLLHPVRLCLHRFLDASDVLRFMQASHSTTVSLLADYTFVDHVSTFHSHTVAETKRSIALFARYRMRILRMCLPASWKEGLIDSETGQSCLPPSLVALSLGQDSVLEEHRIDRRSVVYAPFDGSDQQWSEDEWQYGEEERQLERRIESWERDNECNTWSNKLWNVFEYASRRGYFNRPLPPGALPRGLRYVEFNYDFNQPLQVGSIPDTVEVIKFGRDFDQPLEVGHLPASLTHLVFGRDYDQPLRPGVLPVGLRRLHLGSYNQPLESGVLPAQLRGLHLGYAYE